VTLDRGGTEHDGLTFAGRADRLGEPLPVRAPVAEMEWVRGANVIAMLSKTVRVGELRDPLSRREPEVMTALRADMEASS
jgi:hypothetical protein